MNLKELRRKNKISQDNVAKALGIHRDTFRAIENGKSSLRVEDVPILSRLLNVSETEIRDIYMKKCR